MAPRASAAPPASRAASPADTVAGVRITHPERVIYPEAGLTKLDLARYYERIADWVVPHVSGRPLTLVRCPAGRTAECFYMRHSNVWAPPAVRRVRIPEKTKTGDYLVVDSLAGVISLAQMGVLEIHTWNTTVDHVEEPNRIVLDIDPGPDVGWPDVVATARRIREFLEALGLASWPKTTGGRGLHVVVPLDPVERWEACLEFARGVAVAFERSAPEFYTTSFKKAGREGKILIDYLRNNRTNTSIMAFSTRARRGAPVSVPLSWSALTPKLDPQSLTVTTVPARLNRQRRDPWADYWTCQQRIDERSLQAVAALAR